ncbi:FAD-dependent monooxygenase [Nocardia sp. NPDC004068]|uniref:FAD-dependent monooxygenase n=1 Tax=Nocardia sp. NPDC004068 TaxID=3364303 RepID=UPI003683DB18
MANERGRVGIVGGGIAGLGAAIALRASGWDVTVYERAQRFTEVGAAVFLSGNAVRALDALGLGDAVRAHAVANRPCAVRNSRGRLLFGAHLDDFVGGLVAIHRADLIALLAAAVPDDCVRLGTRVLGADETGRIETDSGTTTYDFVVAADGVHSRLRQSLWPGTPVRRTGILSWRWVLDTPAPADAGFFWGHDAECGVVPMVGDRTVVYAAARSPILEPDHFRTWPAPVPELIAGAGPDRAVRTELLEIAVPRRLWRGRVVLLGDAGHAMLPTLGQGACQALEDAVTLAACLPDPARYSALRRRRVAALSFAARQGMRLTGPGSAATAAMRDAMLAATPDPVVLGALRAVSRRAIGRWSPPPAPAGYAVSSGRSGGSAGNPS